MSIFDGTGYFGNQTPLPSNQMVANPQSFYSMGNYGAPTSTNTGFNWGLNPETFGAVSQGLGAFQSLASIYGMFQNLGLQKKAFKFAREGTKRNFNAQATAFNNAVASKETARRNYAANNNQDYDSLYAYGTGQKIEKWT